MTRNEKRLSEILAKVVGDDHLHALWLNTLSCMEHRGAVKIAKTRSGDLADFQSLQHAAEEARHAWFLKKLCLRARPDGCATYEPEHILAPSLTRRYLDRLDKQICRMLRSRGFSGREFSDLAYLLVTWAIEMRAGELYPTYQEYLKNLPGKFSVQSIINEEEGHLSEMEEGLRNISLEPEELKKLAAEAEAILFSEWLEEVSKVISGPVPNPVS